MHAFRHNIHSQTQTNKHKAKASFLPFVPLKSLQRTISDKNKKNGRWFGGPVGGEIFYYLFVFAEKVENGWTDGRTVGPLKGTDTSNYNNNRMVIG